MQIVCPKCQRQLRVPDTAAGKKVKCPGCGTMFQAIEEVEEIQAAPPRRAPKPPPAAEEAERPRARRRPDDDDAIEEDRPRRRRVQDDEDDRPRRRPRDDEDDYDRPRSRRGRDDDDYDDVDRKADKREARRAAGGAALWFTLAGIVTLIMITLSIASNLYITLSLAPAGANAGPRIVGMLGCGVVVIVGAIGHFLAASSLRSLDGKGRVVSAIVFGFLFGALFGLGVVINILLLSQVPAGFLTAMVFVALILGGLACFFNFFAAIRGIVALNNRAVSRAFSRR
jgi:predicted Zn finger-like uncharacterized protein